MLGMLRIDVAERRRRLGIRHALCPADRADDPVEAARRVVALHATDPATVFLAVRARTDSVTPAAVAEALYERRALVRMLGMRRTMFVVPSDLMAVIEESTMPRIASAQRRLLIKHLRELTAVSDPEPWLADVERSVLRALAARGGTATAEQLSRDEPRLRTTLVVAQGKPYEARQNITSRVLLLLGAQGFIVRGLPTGSLLSQRYQWALARQWLQAGESPPPAQIGAGLAGAGMAGAGMTGAGMTGAGMTGAGMTGAGMTGAALTGPGMARAELARRWLAAFGPAPLADLQWWTGWSKSEATQAAADLGVREVDLDGSPGMVLPDDLDTSPAPGPWAALLPALDPTVMGWLDRGWFLGDHEKALFDRTGNVGPTAWLDGRIVGGWAQRGDGEIAVKLLEDIGGDATELVQAEAVKLRGWLGDLRFVPRFRTPVERELSA
jgi:Winged helix DNA-binding domain